MAFASSKQMPKSFDPLCLACSASLPPDHKSRSSVSAAAFITECCRRPICPSCISANPRLARYNPCLACLGGVRAVNTTHRNVATALPLTAGSVSTAKGPPRVNVDGGVEDEDVFVLGEDNEEDLEDNGPIFQLSGDGEGLSLTTQTPPPPASPPPEYSASAPGPGDNASAPSTAVPYGDADSLRTADHVTDPYAMDPSKESAPAQAPTNSIDPSKYYVQPGDTLVGIALRLGVDGRQLCRMNNMPASTLTTTPHLLHTRSFIRIPPSARSAALPESPEAKLMREHSEQERLARRRTEQAEKRFQVLMKEVDWRVAKAYVAVAQDMDEDAQDGIDKKEDLQSCTSRELGASGDAPSSAQAGALEERAIHRYLDDDRWEAENGPAMLALFPGTSCAAEVKGKRKAGWKSLW